MMGMIVLAGTLVVGNVLFTMFTHQHIWSGADMYTRMSGSGFYNGSISAERGSIYDSKGEVLAQNVAAYTITACLDEEMKGAKGEQLYVSDYPGTAEKLASVLGDAVDVDTLVQTMQNAKAAGRDQTELGAGTKRISKEQKEAIEELNLPGIDFIETSTRNYPNGIFASHLLGFATYDEEEQQVFRETLESVNMEIGKLPQKYSELWDVFKAVSNKRDLEVYAQSLRLEDRRQEFYERLTAYASCLKIALSTRAFHERTSEEDIKRYKDDLNMFVKLRTAVQLRYSDAIDYRQYEGQIQKLINRHVESGAARPITELVNIFDTEAFEQEVARVVGAAAKADTIASRTSKYIRENMDTDPVFYKKFSQLLKETIEAYEQGRIDELEYLKRVQKYKEDVLTHTDNELPEVLKNNQVASAYFGIALETYQRLWGEADKDVRTMALDTACAFDQIIRTKLMIDGGVLVDWQSKSDIIGKMKIELEDYLIDEVKRKYDVDFSFADMDVVIDGCVDVAKLWIK